MTIHQKRLLAPCMAEVVGHLRAATMNLSAAHRAAGETEGDRTNLIGPLRDVIFGLNSAIESLAALVDESAS